MEILRNNHGTVIIFVTLFFLLTMLFVSVGIDAGWMTYVRNQGQASVDAAALSGASGIPRYNETGDDSVVITMVQALNGENTVMNKPAGITASNLEVVAYNSTTHLVSTPASFSDVNGIRVTRGFDTPLFFGRLLNDGQTPTINVSAVAVTRLRPSLPFNLIDDPLPGEIIYEITQSPSPSDNSSYTSFFTVSTSDEVLNTFLNKPGTIPCLMAGDQIELNNGQVNTVLKNIKGIFNTNKTPDPNSPSGVSWQVLVPIISPSDFDSNNPVQTAPIANFAVLNITEVKTQGDPKFISAYAGGDFTNFWCPPILVR